jgi:hypothetical protein
MELIRVYIREGAVDGRTAGGDARIGIMIPRQAGGHAGGHAVRVGRAGQGRAGQGRVGKDRLGQCNIGLMAENEVGRDVSIFSPVPGPRLWRVIRCRRRRCRASAYLLSLPCPTRPQLGQKKPQTAGQGCHAGCRNGLVLSRLMGCPSSRGKRAARRINRQPSQASLI